MRSREEQNKVAVERWNRNIIPHCPYNCCVCRQAVTCEEVTQLENLGKKKQREEKVMMKSQLFKVFSSALMFRLLTDIINFPFFLRKSNKYTCDLQMFQ